MLSELHAEFVPGKLKIRSAMDLQRSRTGKPIERHSSGAGPEPKISLDDYLSFIESRDKSDYSARFINQIIKLHGFRRIYNNPKKVLVEAVESINMMNMSRSTLRQNISPGLRISQDEGDTDIKFLDWFECANCFVTSVRRLNMNYEAPPSPDLVLNEGDDVPQQPNWKSKGKLPAMHSSSVKTKKRVNRRRFDDMLLYS